MRNVCVLLTALVSLNASDAFSSAALTGEVSELWVNDSSSSNIAFISVGKKYVTPCRTGEADYLIIDLAEPGMKEAYSMALAAFMAKRVITVAGKGLCLGSHEKLKYILLAK